MPALPAWLTTKAVGIFLGALGVLAILVGGVFAIRDMVSDARADGLKRGRAEVQGKWDADKIGRATARAELSEALAEAFHGLDGSLQQTLTKISNDGHTILVRVNKEMANDPRYTSADCSLTPGVLDQVNAARGLSRPAAAAGVRDGGVPAAGAAVRLDIGQPGDR